MTTNRTPRLAIGLPVYNGAEFLGEALTALLGQTYEDFELIISDNASTDATEEICREFAGRDARIRYIRQARNIGSVPNHNIVFTESPQRAVQMGVRRRPLRPQPGRTLHRRARRAPRRGARAQLHGDHRR